MKCVNKLINTWLVLMLEILYSQEIEGKSKVFTVPTSLYQNYNTKLMNTGKIFPYLVPPSSIVVNTSYSQRDTTDGLARDDNLWQPSVNPFGQEPIRDRSLKENDFNKKHFQPILFNTNKYISEPNNVNLNSNQEFRIRASTRINDNKNNTRSINSRQLVKTVENYEKSQRNAVITISGTDKSVKNISESDAEERVTKLLNDFESKLNKILDLAVNKTSDKIDQITILNSNQIGESTSLNVKRSAYGNFTEDNQPKRAFETQEPATVSNPTVSGPRSAPLISDNTAPYAETGYAGPPIQNSNSSRHSGGTLDYDRGERRKQRSQEANRKRGVPLTTINNREQQLKDGKPLTETRTQYINDLYSNYPDTELLTSNHNGQKEKKSIQVNDYIKNTAEYTKGFKNEKENRINLNPFLSVYKEPEKVKNNDDLRFGSKNILNNYIPEEKSFGSDIFEDQSIGQLDSKIIKMNDAPGSMSVKNKRIAQYFPNRDAVKSYGDSQGAFHRGYNSLDHLPPDPYVALFLSHYGKYLPTSNRFGHHYRNLYSYLASNNIHNNKPFGSYKIYEDSDG